MPGKVSHGACPGNGPPLSYHTPCVLPAVQGPLGVEDVDTDDEKDPTEAYEEWKQRELKRIKRDRCEVVERRGV